MHFTREPIIESIITPKDGCKLIVRRSKNEDQEDYYVDALEVVSFGNAFFYRSLEKPKSFLLPIQEYEVLEIKETRMVLKNASMEGSIKIGGGKEASQDTKEQPKKRRRKKKASPAETKQPEPKTPEKEEEPFQEEVKEEKPQEPYLSRLLPPPPKLITETLSRFKEEEILDANLPPEEPSEEKASADSNSPNLEPVEELDAPVVDSSENEEEAPSEEKEELIKESSPGAES